MKAQEFKDLIPDYILGKLNEEQDIAFGNYLKEHPNALDEWQAINASLNNMDVEPSDNMDSNFYAFLDTEKSKVSDSGVKQLVPQNTIKTYSHFILPLVAASIMLLFGFFIGKQWDSNASDNTTVVTTESVQDIKQETEDVRTQLVMSLAEQPSASKRLQALSEATKLDNATEQVIIALFKMLNSDPNINVRLAAVASLSKYVDNPKVREGLVMSITKQDSPLVQIALADLMVTLKEQKSINSMETLLQKPDINSAVKQKLEESIKQII